jgi:galactokinase
MILIFQELVKDAKAHLGATPQFYASAPGRIDLLNTHQDYKGLPVVPVAINLKAHMFAVVNNKQEFEITSREMEKLGQESKDVFPTEGGEVKGKFFGNYFRGVVRTLVKRGFRRWERGLRVYVCSDVPVSEGMASSAAIEVCFMTLLNGAFNLGLTSYDLAELSYLTETRELNIPCGRLDQYSSAFGGGIVLRTRPKVSVEPISSLDFKFVVINSGIRHETGAIHPVRQDEINRGLAALLSNPALPKRVRTKLGARYDEVDWEGLDLKSLEPFFFLMPPSSAKRIIYTLEAQRSTGAGIKLLKGERLSERELERLLGSSSAQSRYSREELLGRVLNEQHEMLRDLYEVSIPEIERIRDAALTAGALGVKISGAGMGGSVVALVKSEEDARSVVDSAISAGAAAARLVLPDRGSEFTRL